MLPRRPAFSARPVWSTSVVVRTTPTTRTLSTASRQLTLATPSGSLSPSLAQVNDAGLATATSYVFDDGSLLTSPYSYPTNAIDAVSSVFMASNIYNEYEPDFPLAASVRIGLSTSRPSAFMWIRCIPAPTTAIAPFEEALDWARAVLVCRAPSSASRSMIVKRIRDSDGLRILSVSSGPAAFFALPRDERCNV